MLRLPDDCIWDSWIADDGELYHLFFRKAPRSLIDPMRRHTVATIGHATTRDLENWDDHGDALLPAASGWDDLAVWTGCVVRGDGGMWAACSTRRFPREDTASWTSESDSSSPTICICGTGVDDKPVLGLTPGGTRRSISTRRPAKRGVIRSSFAIPAATAGTC